MKSKFLKKYIYQGLGFPIELQNVEMVRDENKLYPKIDVFQTSELAIKSLILQKSRITGNQIKFIRSYFSMSLRHFANIVYESHMAVKKWEMFGNETTAMDINIEIKLRLYIYNHIYIKKQNDQKEKLKFHNCYLTLTEMFSHPPGSAATSHKRVMEPCPPSYKISKPKIRPKAKGK